jgi:hypothetical protein
MPQTAAPPQQLSMIRSILMQFWPQICKEKALIVVSIVGLVQDDLNSLTIGGYRFEGSSQCPNSQQSQSF